MTVTEHTANDLFMMADFYEENPQGVAEANMKKLVACTRACARIIEQADFEPMDKGVNRADDIIREELEKIR